MQNLAPPFTGLPYAQPAAPCTSHSRRLHLAPSTWPHRRMEAVFQSSHALFQLRVKDWARAYALHVHNAPLPGALLPWHAFGSVLTADAVQAWERRKAAGGVGGAPQPGQQEEPGGALPFDVMERVAEHDVAAGLVSGGVSVSGETQRRRRRRRALKQDMADGDDDGGGLLQQQAAEEEAAAADADAAQQGAAGAGAQGEQAAEQQQEDADAQQQQLLLAALSLPSTQQQQEQEEELRGPQGGGAVTPARRVPLVVVITLAFSPSSSGAANVHYAQQFIRHAEYHLEELRMQRVLVYIHEVRG